jgi:hypothetical protein
LNEFTFRITGTTDKIAPGLARESFGQGLAALGAGTHFFLIIFNMLAGRKT